MTETLEAQQERWNTESEARITEAQEKAERDRLRQIGTDRLAFEARSVPEVPDVSELEQRSSSTPSSATSRRG